MNDLAESFAWCVAQVTLFTIVAACAYGIAKRRRTPGTGTLLVTSLGIVGLLTLLSISPWPRWLAPSPKQLPATTAIAGEVVPKTAAGQDLADRSARIRQFDSAADNILPRAPLPANESVSFSGASQPVIAETEAPGETKSLPWWRLLLLAAWALITLGLLRLVIGVVYLWHYCRTSAPLEDPHVNALFNQLRRQSKITRSVRLRESSRLGVAATAGIRRPMILLPASWHKWSAEERRAVLAHELAHIEQRHFPAWLFIQLPLVAHYYHPLVHWLARQLRFEQEIAADKLAARLFGERSQYAAVLAGLALSPLPRGPLVSLGLFMSRPFLMRRIAMLRQMNEPVRRFSRFGSACATLLIAAAAIGVAGLRAPREAGAQSTNPDAATTASDAAIDSPTQTAVPPSVQGQPSNPMMGSDTRSTPAAVALLLVSRRTPQITGQTQPEPLSDNAWTIFNKTQLALLKSYFVLHAAVRDPEIAKLDLVQSAADPVELLHERLDVGFYDGSAVMYVRMSCSPNECDDAEKLVDAVVDAYVNEVVAKDRQQRLSSRDLLARSLKKINEELSRKTQEFLDIARESGRTESETGQLMRELDMKRLDRIENELIRLENDQLELETSGEPGNSKFYAERIAQLRERQAELEKKIIDRSEQSVDLSLRRRELDKLERIANDMSIQLEYMDIEASAPEQIQVIQRAVTTGRRSISK